ncbi:alpha/beta hydrolase [Vibrio rotiferianus]|uniref:Alpha/beta hydrolase n=1 Tax=Vibrio rotiferianus TaxID=190895 RepID=A0A7Y3ZDM4_9VIBR|nr:alpha/beta hydrolase [Vibrio rotiferianus]NOH51149.1 alpha/beta hydrolase [Vibrio rotiferianus]
MNKKYLLIDNIPAIIWGEESNKIFIAIHGNKSSKEDSVIEIFSQVAVKNGYQVLSFDLPQHGERKSEDILCKVENCVQDLNSVLHYAKTLSNDISLFACSIGAYFSLLTYKNESIAQSLFLSPLVDMISLINNMMLSFNISNEELEFKKEILTPIGETLYWDYYCYVKENPIVEWKSKTSILYGDKDNITDFKTISDFSSKYLCNLDILENGEHFFHTENQLSYFKEWLTNNIYINPN